MQATLPHLPEVVADMVRFQRLASCRPAEVCTIRPRDVDMSEEVWQYRPNSHKTEHHGRKRLIFIGPKAQDIQFVTVAHPDYAAGKASLDRVPGVLDITLQPAATVTEIEA